MLVLSVDPGVTFMSDKRELVFCVALECNSWTWAEKPQQIHVIDDNRNYSGEKSRIQSFVLVRLQVIRVSKRIVWTDSHFQTDSFCIATKLQEQKQIRSAVILILKNILLWNWWSERFLFYSHWFWGKQWAKSNSILHVNPFLTSYAEHCFSLWINSKRNNNPFVAAWYTAAYFHL